MGGGLPIDLILFGMIAAFLVLRLRGILGRKDGFEPPQAVPGRPLRNGGPIIEGKAEPVPAKPARPLPDPATPLGQTLASMRRVDGQFDPAQFLDGAEAAFRIIVTAFAAGERDTLRPLLSPDTFAVFEGAIAAREAAGEVQTSEIRGIHETTIQSAALHGTVAEIGVRFVSDQITQVLGADGKHVSGADAVMELRDDWSFGRDLARSDPAWRLLQAHSA